MGKANAKKSPKHFHKFQEAAEWTTKRCREIIYPGCLFLVTV